MRASTFTSKRRSLPWTIATLFLAGLFLMGSANAASKDKDKDKANTPEEDDYTNSPFTEYGEFNETEEEEEDTKFLQYGRLFGISLGVGFEAVDGNRGQLYQGGFPVVD